jgi:hypothetical protein
MRQSGAQAYLVGSVEDVMPLFACAASDFFLALPTLTAVAVGFSEASRAFSNGCPELMP